jgi:acyl carrier protein
MTVDDFCRIISVIVRLPLDKVQPQCSFRDDLGIDSLQMVNLIVALAEKARLDLSKLRHMDDVLTVEAMYCTLMGGNDVDPIL